MAKPGLTRSCSQCANNPPAACTQERVRAMRTSSAHLSLAGLMVINVVMMLWFDGWSTVLLILITGATLAMVVTVYAELVNQRIANTTSFKPAPTVDCIEIRHIGVNTVSFFKPPSMNRHQKGTQSGETNWWCPKCFNSLVLKSNFRGGNFWGCSQHPACNGCRSLKSVIKAEDLSQEKGKSGL